MDAPANNPDAPTTEIPAAESKAGSASRNRKLGVVAVVVVALAAGGAALAAGKLHNSNSSGFRGGPPGFSGGGQGFPGGGSGSGSGSGSSGGPRQFGYGFQGGPPSGNGFRGRGFGGGMFGSGFDSAAAYLGISESSLRSQLAAGKTLAQIANATSGKSASGLIDAMVAAERKQLEQAVSSGRLTQSQADQLEANVKTRITAMVNGTFGPGRGGFGRPDGGRGGGGFGPGSPPNGNTSPNGGTSTTPSTHI